MSTLLVDLIDRHSPDRKCNAPDDSGDRGKAPQAPTDGERNDHPHSDRDSAVPSAERRLTPNWFLRYWVPKRPLCAKPEKGVSRPTFVSTLDHGTVRASRSVAITQSLFVQTAPFAYQNIIVVDLDRDDAERYVLSRVYDDGEIPEPSFIVTNPGTGHAHVVWFIEGFVSTLAGKRALSEITYKLTAALGGDPNYVGSLMRNPLATRWSKTWWGTRHRYTFRELASYSGIASVSIPRETSAEARSAASLTGEGRNVSLFDALRFWAYRARREFVSQEEWMRACVSRAAELNAAMNPSDPLPYSEVTSVARSVSRFTWKREGINDVSFNERQRQRSEQAPHVKESRDRWFIALTLVGMDFTQQQIADEFEISKDAAKKLIRRARQWRDEYPHEFFQTAANHPGTLFGGDEAPMETVEEPEPTITLPPVRRFSYRPAVAEERKLRGRHVLEARSHHRLEDYIDDVLISS